MKILEIIPTIGYGGAERFVVDLCNEMVFQGHTISLMVLYPVESPLYNELNVNVNVIRLKKQTGFDLKTYRQINSYIKVYKPDIVHSHLYVLPYLLPSILAKKRIFVHTVHNDAEKEAEGGVKAKIRRFLFKHNLVYAVTISDESKSSFTSYYGLNSQLIYNGRPEIKLSTEEVASAMQDMRLQLVNHDSLIFVNVARIHEAKNQLMLAKAFDNVNKQGTHAEVFIIGGVKNENILQDIKKLASPYVHLMGPRNNPRAYMKAADAFTLSSIYEGMPITMIECFSVGCIPVCTPAGGIKDMIKDGVNGILASSCDQEDYETALMKYFKLSDNERSEMQHKSLDSYTPYNMKTCALKYINYMNELKHGNND